MAEPWSAVTARASKGARGGDVQQSGVLTWEDLAEKEHQVRHGTADGAAGDDDLHGSSEWESDLSEPWESMQLRVEKLLRSNSLDHEQKPFSEKTQMYQASVTVREGKSADGKPCNIIWQPAPTSPADSTEAENTKQNSEHLLAALRHWRLEPPNMSLLVHGGSSHPWQLIRLQQLADQRADFLKSRPRFNDSYFDGQRDPNQGWMAAGNAWRYPAFYISPEHEHTADFTFSPSHTLFIDASLQVQEDHELIEIGDRTMNEWIMDAVTHQPVGRQAAIKDPDGIFYWDLNAHALRANGIVPIDVDLRKSYEEWAKGVIQQRQHPGANQSGNVTSKYLLGFTKRKNIDRWGMLTARILMHEKQRQKKDDDNRLAEGEIRLELSAVKLNKSGHAVLTSLMQDNDMLPENFFAGAVAAAASMTRSAMSGDAMAIVKVQIPGDEAMSSDAFRIGRGVLPKPAKFTFAKRSYHQDKGDIHSRARMGQLQEALSSPDPAASLLRIALVLADSRGAEVENGEIGAFEYSLKELIQDVPGGDYHSHEVTGDNIEIYGQPPRQASKDKSRGRPSSPTRAPSPGSGKIRLSRSSSSGRMSAASNGSGRFPSSPQEKPISLGRFVGRVAIRQPPSFVKKGGSPQRAAIRRPSAKKTQVVPMGQEYSRPLNSPPRSEAQSPSYGGNTVRDAELHAPPSASNQFQADGGAGIGFTPRTAERPQTQTRRAASLDGDAFDDYIDASRPSNAGGNGSRYAQTTPSQQAPFQLPMDSVFDDDLGSSQSLSYGLGLPSDSRGRSPPPSPPDALSVGVADPEGTDGSDDYLEGEDAGDEEGAVGEEEEEEEGESQRADLNLLVNAANKDPSARHSLVYTIAYWIKWKTVESIGDQRLIFGDNLNQPMLVRGNKLGVLVNNRFYATDYDPRWNGDNWQLVVTTSDGLFTKFYIGFSSLDESGAPEPAKAEEPVPRRPVSDIKAEMGGEAAVMRLNTAGRGAGWLAQAWIWPRDLQQEEVRELWLATKNKYPFARRGLPEAGLSALVGPSYRLPPNPFAGLEASPTGGSPTGVKAEGQDSAIAEKRRTMSSGNLPPISTPSRHATKAEAGRATRTSTLDAPRGDLPRPERQLLAPIVEAKVIEKDMNAMLEVPLVNKLAFQRLLNVFSVIVDYAMYSNSYIVIDRVNNFSCTAELMLELALRKNPTSAPVVLVLDSRERIQAANYKLKKLKKANFLRRGTRISSTDFLHANLRQLVRPQALSWLRAPASDLAATEKSLKARSDLSQRLDASEIRTIYESCGDENELRRDGRPKNELIWQCCYAAQLFASGTHYIIFDQIEIKGRPVLGTLGTCGMIFMSGATKEHAKVIECIQNGSPLLLLESTGGLTQAFAHVMKAVRMLKPKWTVDFVLRLVTEYKVRAANSITGPESQQQAGKLLQLDNVHLLDKELARIDLLLSSEENAESWMRNFGLPEVLLLFELWQRAPGFLMRQVQTADVMKKSAEQFLDTLTASFSGGAGGIPELGLGNAEVKVVATAWNRHLLLFHNGDKYNARSWIMQLILYLLALATTSLAIFSTTLPSLFRGNAALAAIMLILPIISALLGTIGTRLRQRQKFSTCKMASYEIVSEIYKFRVKAIEYDPLALSAAVAAQEAGGKEKEEEEEAPKPISGKDRDRIARRIFVQRVKNVYTNCMSSELSTGTSISHTSSFGLDPARLLRETDDEESEKETRQLLQKHVAEKLYFLKSLEWERGAEGYKELMAKNAKRKRIRMQANAKAFKHKTWVLLAGGVIGMFERVERSILNTKAKYKHNAAVRRGEVTDDSKERYRAKDDEDNDIPRKSQEPTWLQKQHDHFKAEGSKQIEEVPMDADDVKAERLDESNIIVDDEVENENAASSGTGGRVADNLFGPLTIDDYMTYRARPICTYFERTAPWRAFELQLFEILVFFINSFGAVLVGLGEDWVPYVSLSVAVAAVLKSFTDFANLEKQVEAYNSALREVHNMMNEWDGKTRTERRTRQTIKQVVGTIETALQNVAIALTDAQPQAQAGEEGDGEGESEEKDKPKEK